jgi:vacuolar-type H+-ATPase subunit D/Vma8
MNEINDYLTGLKQIRDELRVQIHLAKKEVQEDWEELEDKMEDMVAKAQLAETGEGVSDAVEQLGDELKLGYQRIRDAIKSN